LSRIDPRVRRLAGRQKEGNGRLNAAYLDQFGLLIAIGCDEAEWGLFVSFTASLRDGAKQ
jgi:hypothetical protein